MFEIKLKDNSQLIIREAEEKDAAALIDYVNRVAGQTDFLSFEAGEFNKTIQEEQKIILDHRESPNKTFLIAEVDKGVAGLLSVGGNQKNRTKHIAEFGISVDKKYWGKGVGSVLMQSMIDWAKNGKIIRKINLTVQENNEAAIALYKKFNFKEEGLISREALINNKFYNSYWMGLEID